MLSCAGGTVLSVAGGGRAGHGADGQHPVGGNAGGSSGGEEAEVVGGVRSGPERPERQFGDTAGQRARGREARLPRHAVGDVRAEQVLGARTGAGARTRRWGAQDTRKLLDTDWFWFSALDLERDGLKDLAFRGTASAGLGYVWWSRGPADFWKTSAGPGVTYERFHGGEDTGRRWLRW